MDDDLDYSLTTPTPPPAPEGYTATIVYVSYYGSHAEEDGVDDEPEYLYLAIPTDSFDQSVEYSMSYGHYSSMPIQPCPPKGTLFHNGVIYTSFDVEKNQARIDDLDQQEEED